MLNSSSINEGLDMISLMILRRLKREDYRIDSKAPEVPLPAATPPSALGIQSPPQGQHGLLLCWPYGPDNQAKPFISQVA